MLQSGQDAWIPWIRGRGRSESGFHVWARFVLDRPLTNCAHPNPPPLARINASSPSGTGTEICIEPEMAIALWS